MKSVIDMLYNGDIIPWEDIVPKDPEYIPIGHKVCTLFEQITQKLADEDKELVTELDNSLLSLHAMGYQANFDYWF